MTQPIELIDGDPLSPYTRATGITTCVAGERLTSYQRVAWSVCRPVEDVNNVTSIGARDLDPDDAAVLEAEHG